MPHFQRQWFIHSHLSDSPIKELFHETGGKHIVTVQGGEGQSNTTIVNAKNI
jgi:hypothetical protein